MGGVVPSIPSGQRDRGALRDAILHHLDELERPFRSAALAATPLRRFKLAWVVLLPRLTAIALSTARHGWRGESWAPESEHAAMRRLVELTGKDPAAARQDAHWMVHQLGLLRPPAPDFPLPEADPSQRVITRAELERVADALIEVVLDDRRTDDPLLMEALSSYAACEQLQKEAVEQSVERPGSLRRLGPIQKAYERRRAEAERRCREAWARWLDQEAASGRS
jgi:hypothetical protein